MIAAARAAARIAVLVAVALVLLPVQIVTVRRGWAIADRIPVVFHRLALWALRVRVVTHGAPDARRPLLLAANHVSWLDIVVLGALQPLSFIAKSEVAGWPVFGTLARLQRTVFVERQRRARTGEAASRIGERLAAGDVMVLFAEGTTSDNRTVLPFLTALFGVAAEAGTTVQPVALCYTRVRGLAVEPQLRARIAWYGDMDLLPHLWRLARLGPIEVSVVFCPVLPPLPRKSVARAAEAEVRRAVGALASGSVIGP